MTYSTIIAEKEDNIAIITLNRPEALNALNSTLMNELTMAVEEFENDAEIGCMIITGSQKAFAAGADIKEMAGFTFADAYGQDFITKNWESAAKARKPIIAAVAGFALGGGCELAMMCDYIIAADNAKFGQPEIKLGVIPGAGGTQRLVRAIGKAKAMELVLTGGMMDAAEAEKAGLVARVVALEELLEVAKKSAKTIASYGRLSVLAAKEAVNSAFESTLSQGLKFERRLFHALFATEDQKEGMDAFANKRKAEFKGK
ncbi:enoyl-CoA hydratase [Pseudaquidulcibacter saccharophilus]|uniref:enoyl-CoA hydratase n=1 Tax=Pseudaquidulcibacter saccharophilus TaxID=2831900 RepID=UPI001EFF1DB0|nr:enoyl-CoA hydratase [Pseudaquidulcibacter saccharophilus]